MVSFRSELLVWVQTVALVLATSCGTASVSSDWNEKQGRLDPVARGTDPCPCYVVAFYGCEGEEASVASEYLCAESDRACIETFRSMKCQSKVFNEASGTPLRCIDVFGAGKYPVGDAQRCGGTCGNGVCESDEAKTCFKDCGCQESTCALLKTFDPSSCSCFCAEQLCPRGQWFNFDSCACSDKPRSLGSNTGRTDNSNPDPRGETDIVHNGGLGDTEEVCKADKLNNDCAGMSMATRQNCSGLLETCSCACVSSTYTIGLGG